MQSYENYSRQLQNPNNTGKDIYFNICFCVCTSSRVILFFTLIVAERFGTREYNIKNFCQKHTQINFLHVRRMLEGLNKTK